VSFQYLDLNFLHIRRKGQRDWYPRIILGFQGIMECKWKRYPRRHLDTPGEQRWSHPSTQWHGRRMFFYLDV